ncbi:MAG: CBS domain-containing protein [Pseudomonadota bacterium]
MKIKDRPEYHSKPKPMTAAPADTIRDAVARMSEKNYGAVVVVDSAQQVLGMVTERDIMKRVVNAGVNPDTTPLSEIMTSDVRVAREDDELLEWLRMMSNERFRRLPVVDDKGKLVSIMTQGDFVSYTWPDLMSQAMTFARSTVSNNYPIFLILGAGLIYTIIIAAAVVAAFS